MWNKIKQWLKKYNDRHRYDFILDGEPNTLTQEEVEQLRERIEELFKEGE